MSIKRNLGTIDRTVRILVGVAVLSIVLKNPNTFWAYLGLLPLFGGIVGYCPPYKWLGINTYRK